MNLFDYLNKKDAPPPQEPQAAHPEPRRDPWEDSPVAPLLKATLACAVPLWIDQIKRCGWSWEMIKRRAQVCGEEVASKGDIIQFKSKGTAEAFNRLAEGLACLAFVPGGVTFLGDRWEAQLESAE